MKESFQKDMGYCKMLNLEMWEARSIWRRIAESLVRLLSPLL